MSFKITFRSLQITKEHKLLIDISGMVTIAMENRSIND